MRKISDTKININIKSIISIILCLVGGILILLQAISYSTELKESGEMMFETYGIPFIILGILAIIGSIISSIFKKGGSFVCTILGIAILVISVILYTLIAIIASILLLIGGNFGYMGSRKKH